MSADPIEFVATKNRLRIALHFYRLANLGPPYHDTECPHGEHGAQNPI